MVCPLWGNAVGNQTSSSPLQAHRRIRRPESPGSWNLPSVEKCTLACTSSDQGVRAGSPQFVPKPGESVFGCTYHGIADESCSATTLRDRRDEWIEPGVIDAALREAVLEAYDRHIGLEATSDRPSLYIRTGLLSDALASEHRPTS